MNIRTVAICITISLAVVGCATTVRYPVIQSAGGGATIIPEKNHPPLTFSVCTDCDKFSKKADDFVRFSRWIRKSSSGTFGCLTVNASDSATSRNWFLVFPLKRHDGGPGTVSFRLTSGCEEDVSIHMDAISVQGKGGNSLPFSGLPNMGKHTIAPGETKTINLMAGSHSRFCHQCTILLSEAVQGLGVETQDMEVRFRSMTIFGILLARIAYVT
ncbi:MAG: hypothetical protein ACE5FN_01485 [Leptospirillia bacterium]